MNQSAVSADRIPQPSGALPSEIRGGANSYLYLSQHEPPPEVRNSSAAPAPAPVEFDSADLRGYSPSPDQTQEVAQPPPRLDDGSVAAPNDETRVDRQASQSESSQAEQDMLPAVPTHVLQPEAAPPPVVPTLPVDPVNIPAPTDESDLLAQEFPSTAFTALVDEHEESALLPCTALPADPAYPDLCTFETLNVAPGEISALLAEDGLPWVQDPLTPTEGYAVCVEIPLKEKDFGKKTCHMLPQWVAKLVPKLNLRSSPPQKLPFSRKLKTKNSPPGFKQMLFDESCVAVSTHSRFSNPDGSLPGNIQILTINQ